jgi:hypothetical protein
LVCVFAQLYRQGKMPYTMENVVIIPGGRGGLSRVMACLVCGTESIARHCFVQGDYSVRLLRCSCARVLCGLRTKIYREGIVQGNINVGYGVPDYTAYEELLGNLRYAIGGDPGLDSEQRTLIRYCWWFGSLAAWQ